MSQRSQILAALKAGRRITPKDAMRDYACMRLGARIYDLKQAGHDIHRRIISDGDKHYAEYWLPERAAA